MTLSEFKKALVNLDQVNFIQPNGNFVPRHYHLTEIGLSSKQFVDCGGTLRIESRACLQLWVSIDYDHRLKAEKLGKIIETSLPIFNGEDLEIEVEFETDTVGKYGVEFNGKQFMLTNTKTDCLAGDACGLGNVLQKAKVSLGSLTNKVKSEEDNCCSPSSGCC